MIRFVLLSTFVFLGLAEQQGLRQPMTKRTYSNPMLLQQHDAGVDGALFLGGASSASASTMKTYQFSAPIELKGSKYVSEHMRASSSDLTQKQQDVVQCWNMKDQEQDDQCLKQLRDQVVHHGEAVPLAMPVDFNNNIGYTSDIVIGGQTFTMQYDTGSSVTWVMDKDCQAQDWADWVNDWKNHGGKKWIGCQFGLSYCPCDWTEVEHHYYDSGKSKTFVEQSSNALDHWLELDHGAVQDNWLKLDYDDLREADGYFSHVFSQSHLRPISSTPTHLSM